MFYDADAYLDGLLPPRYRHHQCTYYGRVLSFDQWAALTRHLEILSVMLRHMQASAPEAANAALALVRFRVSMKKIVDAVFQARCPVQCADGVKPPRRGWLITRPARVSDLIAELPLEAQVEAVKGFTRSQAERQQAAADLGEMTTTTPPTPPPNATGSETSTNTPPPTTPEDDPTTSP